MQGVENWVLCRIFVKKRGDEETVVEVGNVVNDNVQKKPKTMPVFYDFLATMSARKEKNGVTSSGSSGVTEAACGRGSGEHED